MRKGLFSLPFILILVDLISKYLTTAAVPPMSVIGEYPFGGIPIFENLFGVSFSLNYVENQGAAWGLFAGYRDILFLFRCGVILLLFVYLLTLKRGNPHYYPMILIFSGACGNVADYLLYGHVVDMFHFVLWGYSFPVFNVADSLITIGAVWFVTLAFLEKREKMVTKNS